MNRQACQALSVPCNLISHEWATHAQDRGAKRNAELSFNGNLKWNMLRQWIGAKSEGRKETVAHTVFPSIRMFD